MDKNLDCIFLHHNDPYLRIAPFQYEFLSKEPGVGLVHNLIGNTVVEGIKHDAKPTLKTTPYQTGDQGGAYVDYSRWRTSKVTYFKDKLNANAHKISKNIELVTNCILASNKYDSENFQVRYT